MTRTYFLAAALVAVVTLTIRGQDLNLDGGDDPDAPYWPAYIPDLKPGESLPVGPPPEHAFAKIQDGQLYLRTFLFQQDARVRAKVIEKDGAEFVEEVITRKRTAVPLRSIWPLTSARGFVDGKQLDAMELVERLTKEHHVLLSADIAKVDPLYLEIVKAGTLILVLPRPLTLTHVDPREGAPYGASD